MLTLSIFHCHLQSQQHVQYRICLMMSPSQKWFLLSVYEVRHKIVYGIITSNNSLLKCEMVKCNNVKDAWQILYAPQDRNIENCSPTEYSLDKA